MGTVQHIDFITDRYDIDLNAIFQRIIEKNHKKVAIQLPDGFKRHALEMAKAISENTGAEVFIWGGSNYGACDIPYGLEKFGITLLIQFGHAKFRADNRADGK
ncbi:MAG: diphthamide synthesis protein [Candidatus Parvarchaeota archaeon]|nr:diphthamide synthesis protein [Candidatus Parvarchaeota archaeon]MCW1301516.1 diphthamide synthesis protein [Candidatus Parvarchaeota archaeon]